MKGQHVKLITRQIGISDDDPAELVTAVMIGDQRLELPMGSDLRIEYRGAGNSIAEVHVVLVAATVRYEEEPPPVPPDAEVHVYDPEIDG